MWRIFFLRNGCILNLQPIPTHVKSLTEQPLYEAKKRTIVFINTHWSQHLQSPLSTQHSNGLKLLFDILQHDGLPDLWVENTLKHTLANPTALRSTIHPPTCHLAQKARYYYPHHPLSDLGGSTMTTIIKTKPPVRTHFIKHIDLLCLYWLHHLQQTVLPPPNDSPTPTPTELI